MFALLAASRTIDWQILFYIDKRHSVFNPAHNHEREPAREPQKPDELLNASLPPLKSEAMEVETNNQQKGASAFKEVKGTFPATEQQIVDRELTKLTEAAARWTSIDLSERIKLVDDLLLSLKASGRAWVDATLEAKGIEKGSPVAGEEWLAGPQVTARNLSLLKQTLSQIKTKGIPELPSNPVTRPDGQVVVKVFPAGIYDRLMFPGYTGEVWMAPGVTKENLPETMARSYREKNNVAGGVSLVLAAGNVSSIGPMDALHKIFIEHKAVILKMNPVNEYLGPHFEKAFKPLIDKGLLSIVYGGATEGQYLCHHPQVTDIHITGSDKTHDAIVFGTGEEGKRRKEQNDPLLKKTITSELGNVSPVIVVPGPWSNKDCAFHGENLASMLTNNAGFNCNATRVIITSKEWDKRETLLNGIRDTFKKVPSRKAYYPGAEERHTDFVTAHPDAEQYGERRNGTLPWTFIPGLDENNPEDICFNVEAFCSVTSEVPLTSTDTVDFIRKAVTFANDSVWGSLNAAIIVHPKSLKDPAIKAALDEAVADLKAGSIGINHWPALSYVFCSTTWGAHPGHTPQDIRSGTGVVHNTYMFESPEKSVVRGPFRQPLKPAWFATHKTVDKLAEELFYFEIDHSLTRLPALSWHALRG